MAFTGAEKLSNYLEKLTKIEPEFFEKTFEFKSGLVSGLKTQEFPGPRIYGVAKYSQAFGVGGYDDESTAIDGSALPESSYGDVLQFQEDWHSYAFTHKLTQSVIEGLDTKAAIINTAARIAVEAQRAIRAYLRVLVHAPYYVGHITGTAYKGYLARFTTDALGTTISTSGTSVAMDADSDATNPAYGAWLLQRNMILDVYDGSTKKGTVLVDDISNDRKTVVLKAIGSNITLDASTTHYFYFQNYLSSSSNFVPFQYIADDDGTLHNIDRSSVNIWQGALIDNAGAALTVETIQNLYDELYGVNLEIEEPKVKVMFTTKRLLRALADDFFSGHSYEPERVSRELTYGNWAIKINDIQIEEDPYVVPGTVLAPDFNTLVLYRKGQPDFVRMGGRVVWPQPGNPGVHYVVILHYIQLVTNWPGHNGKIVRISGDIF